MNKEELEKLRENLMSLDMKYYKDKTLIECLIKLCKNNIERIDRLIDTEVATDTDIGSGYTYRKILNFIEEGRNKND